MTLLAIWVVVISKYYLHIYAGVARFSGTVNLLSSSEKNSKFNASPFSNVISRLSLLPGSKAQCRTNYNLLLFFSSFMRERDRQTWSVPQVRTTRYEAQNTRSLCKLSHSIINVFYLILSIKDQIRRQDAEKSRWGKSGNICGGLDEDDDSEEQEEDDEEEEEEMEIPMVGVHTICRID